MLIGHRACRARVQHGTQGETHLRQCRGSQLQLFQGITTHADEHLRLQNLNQTHQVALAGGIQGFHLALGQLGGGDVGAGLAHPDKRAVVGHIGMLEKFLRRAVHILEHAPETATAHLRTRTGKALHRTLRVRLLRAAHRGGDTHPQRNSRNLAKGNAGLRHAEGPRIHAQVQHILLPGTEFANIGLMPLPGVIKRVIGIGHRGGKLQGTHLAAQFLCGGNQLFSLHAPTIT